MLPSWMAAHGSPGGIPSPETKGDSESMKEKKRLRARVNVGKDESGEIIYKWASAYGKRELKEEKARIASEYAIQQACGRATANIQPSAQASVSFRDYADKWYMLYKCDGLRQSSRDMYANVFKVHLYPTIGSAALVAVTTDDLQIFINGYRGKSKSLIDKIMMVLRQIFAAAYEDGIVGRNPMNRVKEPDGTEQERMPVPMEAVKPLTFDLLHHDDGLLPLLMLYTGIRRGEALGLIWSDVGADSIHVRRGAVFHGNTTTIGEPKTHAALRTIPLPAFVGAILETKRADTGYVFGGMLPWTQSKHRRTWDRLKRDVPALVGVSPHRLRHTYTMLLRRAGVDPATMQYLLGHEDYETTVNTYTHIDQMDISDARNKIAKIVPELLPQVR